MNKKRTRKPTNIKNADTHGINEMVTSRNILANKLVALYTRLQDWRGVGAFFGISGGMAYRVAMRGYEPKRSDIRLRLGLPVLAPVPVCPKCGAVHVTKRCTANLRRVRTPEEIDLAKRRRWARDWDFLASTAYSFKKG